MNKLIYNSTFSTIQWKRKSALSKIVYMKRLKKIEKINPFNQFRELFTAHYKNSSI